MCFHIGIDINRAEHIRLKKIEKKIKDQQLDLHRPLASGFDHPMWPAIKPSADGLDINIEMMNWGFIPSYIRTPSALDLFRKGGTDPDTGKKQFPVNTLNAIGEEVLAKPTYKEAAHKRRCLVICSGFYEWRHFKPQGAKDIAYPYYISLKEKEYFFMAGIYNPWTDQESGETFDSFSILTTAANSLMSLIHNKKKRMPVILPEEEAAAWIKPGQSTQSISELAQYKIPSAQLQTHTIRKDFRQLQEPREAFDYAELPPL